MEFRSKINHRRSFELLGSSSNTDTGTTSKIMKPNDETNCTSVFSRNHTKDSGIGTLDDSFVCLEDTQTLINKNIIENANTNSFVKEFAEYCDMKNAKLKLTMSPQNKEYEASSGFADECDNTQLSQFFNKTEVMNQLDTIVSEAKSTIQSKDDSDKENDKSFINKKNVHDLFDKLETTICELGHSNQHKSEQKERKEFSKDIKLLKTIVQKVISVKSDHDEHLLNEAEIDSLFNITPLESSDHNLKESLLEREFKTSDFKTQLADIESFKRKGNFYDLPDKVKTLIKLYRGIDKLYEWQDQCLNLSAIKNRKNLVYALPTSGGKTLVAEILLLREVLCRSKNVIFVLPYVAIVQEKVWGLSPFAVALEFLIEEYAGGKGSCPPRKRRRKNSVYIATIEKALGLVNSLIDSDRLSELGLVVVDELHLIGDKSRGPVLESFLTKLKHLNGNLQIIGMSATIGNLNEICTFLNADMYSQNFRPVDLVEYVKCNDEIAKINYEAADESDFFEYVRTVDTKYSENTLKTDPDKLTALVMEVIPHSSCLIFCSTKKNCENVAMVLCKVMFPSIKEYKKPEKTALLNALKKETQSLCSILKIGIQFGVAYHHSGLTTEERQLIEDGFRHGIISVICCTSTLAAGVNLPAKRVILRQPYVGRDFINLSRYKQMVGRAGRAGLEEHGESIVICTQPELPKLKSMLMAPMDLSLSNMHDEKALRQFLLSCIALDVAKTRSELHQISKKTLLAVQETRLNVNLKKIVDDAIKELFMLQAIELTHNDTSKISTTLLSSPNNSHMNISSVSGNGPSKRKIVVSDSSKLVVSKLGLAAIKGGLELSKARLLYDDLLKTQTSLVLLNCLHLLYLVTPYDVPEQIQISKSHYYNIYSQLQANELQTAKILGIDESCALKLLTSKPIKSVPERVLNRFYVSLMLLDLWNETPVYQVAEKFQVNRGIVQNLMMSAASFASNVVNFCEVLEEFWPFASLLSGMSTRLQHCCVKELIPLMELPNVKQNRARQLYNAGFKNLQSIAKADPNELIEKIEHMSRKVANQLIAASKMLLLEKVENLREEAENVLEGTETIN